MTEIADLPRLYTDLASWWPLLSPPEDYAEEAEFYRRTFLAASATPPRTLLELGSGGGNNASYLKSHFRLTLVDLAPAMLEVSRQLNPECEHIEGDMRMLRLGRQFDLVFIHDAIGYMTSEGNLRQAVVTAYKHCRAGGVALFAPDFTRESFRPNTEHGGHDGRRRAVRYLEWSYDPDPNDCTYVLNMAYLLRQGQDDLRCVFDRHLCGLFAHNDWLRVIGEVGFLPRSVPFEHSQVEAGSMVVFLGLKPADAART